MAANMETRDIIHLVGTSIVLCLIILTTCIGNVFVVAAILLERNLQNAANSLVASLSVADLLVAALVMPLAAVNEVSSQWSLGERICDAWIAVDVLCCTSSILHLVSISIDRYWAVSRVDYIHNRSMKRMCSMIFASWGISTLISIPPLFSRESGFTVSTSILRNRTQETTRSGSYPLECLITQDLGYTVFSTVGAFYIPLLFMIIIYVNIYRTAKFRIRKNQFRPDRRHRRSGSDMELESGIRLNFPTTDGVSGVSGISGTSGTVDDIHPDVLPFTPHSRFLSASNIINGASAASLRRHEVTADFIINQSVNPSSEAAASSAAVVAAIATAALATASTQTVSNRQFLAVTPSSTPRSSTSSRGSWIEITREYFERRRSGSSATRRAEGRYRERKAQRRERKAARTLVIITGAFVICWLPFFVLTTVRPFCGRHCRVPPLVTSVVSWLGYLNSLLNPIIYTVFNPDFRSAFRKLLIGKYKKR